MERTLSEIHKIHKYSIEDFKIRLSYEFWLSIFSNNDNMYVDMLFSMFLNKCLRIFYKGFPLKKVARERQ
jgi:hypothetical protein